MATRKNIPSVEALDHREIPVAVRDERRERSHLRRDTRHDLQERPLEPTRNQLSSPRRIFAIPEENPCPQRSIFCR
jgi:hypothetical protein